MDGLNSFLISFCVSCILLGFLFILCPSGSMNAPVKYVFGLCFVCCVIGTVIAIPKPEFSYFDKSENTTVLTEQNSSISAQMVFSEALRQQNIKFRKLTVDTNKLKDDSISISRVTVYTDESAEKIIQAIGSDSYEVIVINE